jgi:Mn2+/Fe2+ NRAMP family transporter
VISEKVMDVLSKVVVGVVVVLFAYALFYVATIPKQCLNGYVYEKSINDYWTKTKTECLPVSKE